MTATKTVQRVKWDSFDGVVLYRDVYSDGSRGALISAGFHTNDPKASQKMQRIEKERTGQTVRS